MLVINQGNQNQIFVTVSEKQIGTGSLFLFQFVDDTSNSGSSCLAYDSSSTARYNQFTLTETGSANNYNAQVSLPLAGFYHYTIFEAVTSSLSPTGLNVVEIGKCLVVGTTSSVIAFTGSNDQFYVYDPSKYST